jgi:hypothetical protein
VLPFPLAVFLSSLSCCPLLTHGFYCVLFLFLLYCFYCCFCLRSLMNTSVEYLLVLQSKKGVKQSPRMIVIVDLKLQENCRITQFLSIIFYCSPSSSNLMKKKRNKEFIYSQYISVQPRYCSFLISISFFSFPFIIVTQFRSLFLTFSPIFSLYSCIANDIVNFCVFS